MGTIKENKNFLIRVSEGWNMPMASESEPKHVKDICRELFSVFKDKIEEGEEKYIKTLMKSFYKIKETDLLYINDGFLLDGNPIDLKKLGRILGLNRLPEWSVYLERNSLDSYTVKYYTKYTNLRKYYKKASCSSNSCMRYSFENLPLHPCAVYAHDLEEFLSKNKEIAKEIKKANFYISGEIRLAVLFNKEGEAIARAMVSHNSRGKCFGKGASLLAKKLNLECSGLKGSINIIEIENDCVIMPYIDNVDFVDEEDGLLDYGNLSTTSTDGKVSKEEQVYSKYFEEYIREDEAVYSEAVESYIPKDSGVELYEGGYAPDDYDQLYFSEREDQYFVDTDYWIVFNDEWLLEETAEEVVLEYIKDNAGLSEMIDFAEEL